MRSWRSLRFEFSAMGSPCEIQLDGRDETAMRRAADAAIAEVRRIESKYSRYRQSSVIGRINAAAGQDAVAVDAETAALLDFAHNLWVMSDGLFDITSGVLRGAWDFKAARLPEPGRLDQLLRLVGWGKVEWKSPSVRLPAEGMELDFGGFAKEYAVDRAANVLLQHQIGHALVNLGGDIHALGPRGLPGLPDQDWHIAIQHPRPQAGADAAAIASLSLQCGGLATSGDYERFFDLDGKRYCHILDPRSGWPVSHWQSVSVVAANTTTAGALSTIAMLKGPDALEWLSAQGAGYLAVAGDGTLWRAPDRPDHGKLAG